MIASACLTLAAVHLLVWFKKRTAWANLLFTLNSAAVAAYAGIELWMMRAETPAQFATALRWIHVPTWVIVLSLAGFVRLHLRAGRLWLVWAIFALRTMALLLNFLVGQNLNYREVTVLRHIPFLGESVSLGVGVSNPFMLVGQLSLLLWLIFTADAALTVWRRGDRRLARFTSGCIVFFALASIVQAVLVLWQIVDWPLMVSFFYLGIVVAMGYDLSRETLRASQLSDDLRESEARMVLAAEAANIGVWVYDLVRSEIWASDKWRAIFGFTKSERLNLDEVMQRVHPEDREAVLQVRAKAIADCGHYETEYRVVLPGGEMHWIGSRGRVESDAAGQPVLVRGVSLDITKNKQAEAEALRQRAELAHVARVSTMGELAASVAHELNQPLGAILANAEAADLFLNQDPPALGELQDILTDIRKDDERASEVIRRMRALLRKHEMDRQPIEINSVVEDVLQVVSGDAALRKVAINAELAPGLPKILGDRVHLQQVLINLMLNGMDAMVGEPQERRRLSIRTRSSSAGLVELSVMDSGHGIAPEKLPRVFEPFYTTKPNGMGMGLSISRTIMDAHRGKISVENNPSGGATFRVTLPVAVEGMKS